MEVKIRDFRWEDAKAIVEIHQENEKFFEEMVVDEKFILNISEREDFKFFIAEEGGKVVGCLGTLFHSQVGRAEIGPIGVKKQHQHKAIGRELMKKAFSFLRNLGIRRVITKVKKENKGALNFFKSFGFREEGYFKSYTKKGEDVIQMVRFLK